MHKSLFLSTGVESRIVENQRYLYGRGAQAVIFRLADDEGHHVCVVLEVYGTRHFTSFSDYNAFLDYYTKFKGHRCFYSIDRSFYVDAESSLLHFDIE